MASNEEFMSMLRPVVIQSEDIRVQINIGCCMDIPTGTYITGSNGENILNGGLGAITGIMGPANVGKSLIMHYMLGSASSKMSEMTMTSVMYYDTELTMMFNRVRNLFSNFYQFKDVDVVDTGLVTITDKIKYSGNKFWEMLKGFLNSKIDNFSKIKVKLPYLNKEGKQIYIPAITFTGIDSLTELDSDMVSDVIDKSEIDDSDRNILAMKRGKIKTDLIAELPVIVNKSYNFMVLTVHETSEINMGGQNTAPPKGQLRDFKNGVKPSSVGKKLSYLANAFWYADRSTVLMNDDTKAPEYPMDVNDNAKRHRDVADTDMCLVNLKMVRGKCGPTSYNLPIVISQIEGVLPELTEFHHIKTADRYGMSGTNVTYHLDILPDINISRTTIRNKIENNPEFCRALNITSEMCQIKRFYKTINPLLLCTPKELYDDLIKLGYDWKILLATRGWTTVNNDKHPIPFLSTMDLLKMRLAILPEKDLQVLSLRGIKPYHPYWLMDDKKTMRKGFHSN